jgi:DAACS family dicarboxylate/amino acid:cation (Na+ or H+) symporter
LPAGASLHREKKSEKASSMSDIDTRLANRILLGLVIGAIAGAITLVIGGAVPGVLTGCPLACDDRARSHRAGLPPHAVLRRDPAGRCLARLRRRSSSGELRDLGRSAGRTFLLFFANMAIAATLGLVMMNVLEPGARLNDDTTARLLSEYSQQASQHVEKGAARPDMTPMAIVDMFMPRNLFGAFVGNQRNLLGDVLPLITFAILVGAAGLGLPHDRRKRFEEGLETVAQLMTGIVHFALRLAPIAVPAMIFSVVVKVGFEIILALGLFVLGCVTMLLLHLFGTMSIWLRLSGPPQPTAILPPDQGRAGDRVLDQLEQRDPACGAGRRARSARYPSVDGRVRAAARYHHEHERHGAL